MLPLQLGTQPKKSGAEFKRLTLNKYARAAGNCEALLRKPSRSLGVRYDGKDPKRTERFIHVRPCMLGLLV
tara:strand:- start:360 stop:572 length:213 start_codon:yes stop_codon:yes gene_type:complete